MIPQTGCTWKVFWTPWQLCSDFSSKDFRRASQQFSIWKVRKSHYSDTSWNSTFINPFCSIVSHILGILAPAFNATQSPFLFILPGTSSSILLILLSLFPTYSLFHPRHLDLYSSQFMSLSPSAQQKLVYLLLAFLCYRVCNSEIKKCTEN